MISDKKRIVAAATLGAAAGMRTFVAPAVASMRLQGRLWTWRRNRAEKFLRDDTVGRILLGAAAAELIADKLPLVGDRIKPGPLVARAASGALAGWVVAKQRESAAELAIVGAASAVAVAFAAWGLRRFITRRSSVPDALVGICEDVLAITAARSARFP
jgi:uncharacterized membrane protein